MRPAAVRPPKGTSDGLGREFGGTLLGEFCFNWLDMPYFIKMAYKCLILVGCYDLRHYLNLHIGFSIKIGLMN